MPRSNFYFLKTVKLYCLGQQKSIAHLDVSRLAFMSQEDKCGNKQMTKKRCNAQKVTHIPDLLPLHCEDCNVGFDKSGVLGFFSPVKAAARFSGSTVSSVL